MDFSRSRISPLYLCAAIFCGIPRLFGARLSWLNELRPILPKGKGHSGFLHPRTRTLVDDATRHRTPCGCACGTSISLITFSWYFERRKKKLGSDLAQ